MNPLSSVNAIYSGMMPAMMPQANQVMPGNRIGPSEMGQIGTAFSGNVQGLAGDSFANVLGRVVQDVNAKQFQATDSIRALQSGESIPLHQAVLSMEEASLSFQLMIEVRNKMLESYNELMRMQI